MTIFEETINNCFFRYNGGLVIEVSNANDRHHNVLHEIPVKEGITKKQFDTEISYWFMNNGHSI